MSAEGTRDLTLIPQENSDTVTQFQQGQVDGAWVPEPYASILVSEGGSKLVDEADLWPHGDFVTTQLLVNNDFLKEHADLVEDLLSAQVKADDFIADNPDEAKQITAEQIQTITGGGAISPDVLDSALSELAFTDDPLADTGLASAP